MNKELIDFNVSRAVASVNNDFDFETARVYLSKALDEVGSNKKIAYYDVLKEFILPLTYNVRGFGAKRRVKECFSKMIHFVGSEFETIAFAEIDSSSSDQMIICNEICATVSNCIDKYAGSLRQLYLDVGIISAIANSERFLKEFMPIILRCRRASRDLMMRFDNPTYQVKNNIEIWDGEIKGKNGRKYL